MPTNGGLQRQTIARQQFITGIEGGRRSRSKARGLNHIAIQPFMVPTDLRAGGELGVVLQRLPRVDGETQAGAESIGVDAVEFQSCGSWSLSTPARCPCHWSRLRPFLPVRPLSSASYSYGLPTLWDHHRHAIRLSLPAQWGRVWSVRQVKELTAQRRKSRR